MLRSLRVTTVRSPSRQSVDKLTLQLSSSHRQRRDPTASNWSVENLIGHVSSTSWLPQMIIGRIVRLASHVTRPHRIKNLASRSNVPPSPNWVATNPVSIPVQINITGCHASMSHRVRRIKLSKIMIITSLIGHVAINNEILIRPLHTHVGLIEMVRPGHVSTMQWRERVDILQVVEYNKRSS